MTTWTVTVKNLSTGTTWTVEVTTETNYRAAAAVRALGVIDYLNDWCGQNLAVIDCKRSGKAA